MCQMSLCEFYVTVICKSVLCVQPCSTSEARLLMTQGLGGGEWSEEGVHLLDTSF